MNVIVDYGMGNLHSVYHKVKKISSDTILSSKPEDILSADKLILPGVGHFSKGMENLKSLGLIEPLNEAVLTNKTPVLGICLGMQLFTEHSEEGDADGLGWIKGETKRFKLDEFDLRVPHVGWNELKVKKETRLFDGIPTDYKYYFTHSYYVSCTNPNDILTTTKYGVEFISSIQSDNIAGVQFHPEKSHLNGVNLINNFLC